jgi:hypothetical protein
MPARLGDLFVGLVCGFWFWVVVIGSVVVSWLVLVVGLVFGWSSWCCLCGGSCCLQLVGCLGVGARRVADGRVSGRRLETCGARSGPIALSLVRGKGAPTDNEPPWV